VAPADLLQGLQPVHLGHLHVEQHQVGRGLLQLGQGQPAVGGGARQGHAVHGLHHIAEDPPVDDGVIDDEYPERLVIHA